MGFVVFVTPSRKMPGEHLDEAMTASFPIFFSSSVILQFAARRSRDREQSSNLLRAFVTTVTVSGPVGTRGHICSFQDHLCVLKWGLLFDERKGWTFCNYSEQSSPHTDTSLNTPPPKKNNHRLTHLYIV
jgi:hypothetical protein